MWIVKAALSRPYTFIVMALLIFILSPFIIVRTPTDIFPNIDIPMIAVAWEYTGLNPQEMEGRFTTVYERALTTTVDNIEHLESTTINGRSITKIFLQPQANLAQANAQVTAISQTLLRTLPAGAQPPLILNYSASTVPILQLALSGQGLSEQQLNDLGVNFLRTQLVTVPGAAIPLPYGGKTRQIMVNLYPRLLQSKGLSPADIVTAVSQQSLVLPSGTMKLGPSEYDVRLNASPRTVAELNDLPIKQVGSSTIYLRDVAQVSDGFAPQTNIVRQDGRRGTLLTIMKTGTASTLDVVQGIRDMLPRVAVAHSAPGRLGHLRPCRGKRCHPRSHHRRLSDGHDDLALPGQLAQYAHHCDFYSTVHPDFYHGPQLSGTNHQYYDPWRLGPCCRHPGG
jgi:multidrug efflux pump subunit AcrB